MTKIKPSFYGLLISLILFSASSRTISAAIADPENLIAVMPSAEYFHDWTKLALRHSARKSAHLDIKLPFFEIYNRQGILIYHEDDPEKNGAVLGNLPSTLKGLRIEQAYHASYKEALDVVPLFRSRETALLAGDRYTILAVTMDKCPRCAEEDLLASRLRKDSGRIHVRVLQIVLTRP